MLNRYNCIWIVFKLMYIGKILILVFKPILSVLTWLVRGFTLEKLDWYNTGRENKISSIFYKNNFEKKIDHL